MSIGDELRRTLDGAIDRSRTGWDLSRKMKLYPPDTEARCPYCMEWFSTDRIWLVNNNTNYLVGCWLPDGKPIPADQIVHPHAWMSGEVCLGTFKSASEALFAGIDKGKHVHYVPRWLYQMGHKCDKIPMETCPVCASKFHGDIEIYFGYLNRKVCSNDCLSIAIDFRCEECVCFINMDQRGFCAECAEKLYIDCAICSGKMMSHESFCYSRKDLRCCYDCFRSQMQQCRECGLYERKAEINERNLCETCMIDPPLHCNECGLRRAADQLTDGRCNYCHNFCGDCECSPCECDPIQEEEEEIED